MVDTFFSFPFAAKLATTTMAANVAHYVKRPIFGPKITSYLSTNFSVNLIKPLEGSNGYWKLHVTQKKSFLEVTNGVQYSLCAIVVFLFASVFLDKKLTFCILCRVGLPFGTVQARTPIFHQQHGGKAKLWLYGCAAACQIRNDKVAKSHHQILLPFHDQHWQKLTRQ